MDIQSNTTAEEWLKDKNLRFCKHYTAMINKEQCIANKKRFEQELIVEDDAVISTFYCVRICSGLDHGVLPSKQV